MAPYLGELPGMVWDPTRQRYLTIQSAANATHHQYTQGAVNEAQRQLEAEQIGEKQTAARREQTITRKYLPVWKPGREHESTTRSTRSTANGIQYGFPFVNGDATISSIFQKDARLFNAAESYGPGFPFGPRIKILETFDYDETDGTLLLGHSVGDAQGGINCRRLPPSAFTLPPPAWAQNINLAISWGSSLIVSRFLPRASLPKVQVVANYGAGLGMPLVLPDIDVLWYDDANQTTGNFNNLVAPALMPGQITHIAASAVNPFDTTNGSCIISTHNGYLLIDAQSPAIYRPMLQGPLTAVEYLDRNIWIGGVADQVHVFDLRVESSAFRAVVPSHIRSLKRLDYGRRFVARTAHGHLSSYDFRFVKPPKNKNWSKPYHIFPKVPEAATNRLGIDVSVDLGLLAVADYPSSVSLFSLKTAKKVGHLNLDCAVPKLPHTIRFKQDSEGIPMILAGADDGVLAFRLWENEDD